MNIGLFEDSGFADLLPLTWWRAAFELRCGCDRLVDKVRTAFGPHVARVWVRAAVETVVGERFTPDAEQDGDWLLLNARVWVRGHCPPPPPGTAWVRNGDLLAAHLTAEQVETVDRDLFLDPAALGGWISQFKTRPGPEQITLVRYPWDLILGNPAELHRQLRTGGAVAGRVYDGAHLVAPDQIVIERGVRVKPGVVLDAEDGPIFLDRECLIEPNAVLQGPCYVGPHSVIRPGAAIRGGTSIGPVCKVGGEVEGSILHGYSNKQHDGFLGHSYVGEWVNLGADTVTSDLKNTYGTIRVPLSGKLVETGHHFMGAIIGDHSKTGIGTILPTGCVLGFAANVFTQGAVPKFVPSFGWVTEEGTAAYRVDKAIQIARTVMGRRDHDLSEAEERLLEQIAREAREVEAAGWKE